MLSPPLPSLKKQGPSPSLLCTYLQFQGVAETGRGSAPCQQSPRGGCSTLSLIVPVHTVWQQKSDGIGSWADGWAGAVMWALLLCALPRERTPSLARSCSSSSAGWSWGRAAPATAGLITHCWWIHLQLMGSVWLGLYPWWFLSLKTSIAAVTAVLVARIHSYYMQFCKPKRMLFFWTKWIFFFW